MRKIAIIGANSFQNPLILKAKEMGFETHVFAWQDGSIGEKTADYFYPISIVEKEEILEKLEDVTTYLKDAVRFSRKQWLPLLLTLQISRCSMWQKVSDWCIIPGKA